MLVLPHCGEIDRAARIAEDLKQGTLKQDRGVHFNFARCYAQCMTASTGPARQRYQELSLESLHDALAAGLKDSTSLEAEPDLDPIRTLAQFKVILERLKAAPVANAKQRAKIRPLP
jgi:hypothetical protein